MADDIAPQTSSPQEDPTAHEDTLPQWPPSATPEDAVEAASPQYVFPDFAVAVGAPGLESPSGFVPPFPTPRPLTRPMSPPCHQACQIPEPAPPQWEVAAGADRRTPNITNQPVLHPASAPSTTAPLRQIPGRFGGALQLNEQGLLQWFPRTLENPVLLDHLGQPSPTPAEDIERLHWHLEHEHRTRSAFPAPCRQPPGTSLPIYTPCAPAAHR